MCMAGIAQPLVSNFCLFLDIILLIGTVNIIFKNTHTRYRVIERVSCFRGHCVRTNTYVFILTSLYVFCTRIQIQKIRFYLSVYTCKNHI